MAHASFLRGGPCGSGSCEAVPTSALLRIFSAPASVGELRLPSLWQYVDKAVTDTSSQEGHSGWSAALLIGDGANPLALHLDPPSV